MAAISDDVNVTLYYKKSVTPCVANQTFGAASVDRTPMMWISRGCRGWFTCTATTATPPPSRAGGGLPPGTFMCGSPFEYLSHRWCSCPPSLGADTRSSHGQQQRQQHQQHGVYKANTLGVCGQLEALQRREEALKAQAVKLPQPLPRTRAGSGVVVFAFVRHPLERFVSGYAEVSYRAAGRGGRHGFVQDQAQYAQQAEERTWYSFAREPVGSAARAKAFVRDAAVGRLRAWLPSSSAGGKQGGVGESMDIHVLPQVAFLAPFRGRVDFVASMEDMAGGWAALRSVVLGGGNGSSAPVSSSDAAAATAAAASLWPPYDDGARWQGRQAHVRTDRHSGSPDRTAMQALLSPSVDGGGCATPEALAVHRLLLPDFVCLGYALSEGCKAALGAHGVTCPLELPARYAPRTL